MLEIYQNLLYLSLNPTLCYLLIYGYEILG